MTTHTQTPPAAKAPRARAAKRSLLGTKILVATTAVAMTMGGWALLAANDTTASASSVSLATGAQATPTAQPRVAPQTQQPTTKQQPRVTAPTTQRPVPQTRTRSSR